MDADRPVRRFHLTGRPLAKVRAGPSPQAVGRKPGGLWWASGTAWLEHVRDAGRGRGISSRFREVDRGYEITLKEDPGILTIRTAEDLMEVTMRYGAPPPHVDPARLPPMWVRDGDRVRYDPVGDTFLGSHRRCMVGNIDWQAVSRVHRGIEMLVEPGASGRIAFEWADIDWAVRSGCVWDTGALAKVMRVPWEEFLAFARIMNPDRYRCDENGCVAVAYVSDAFRADGNRALVNDCETISFEAAPCPIP